MNELQKEQRRRLLDMRLELERQAADGAAAASTVMLDQTAVGRLSRMDAMQSQAMSEQAQRSRTARLVSIEAALLRLEAGGYGDCQDCGELIAPGRLEIDPLAVLCIACASARE